MSAEAGKCLSGCAGPVSIGDTMTVQATERVSSFYLVLAAGPDLFSVKYVDLTFLARAGLKREVVNCLLIRLDLSSSVSLEKKKPEINIIYNQAGEMDQISYQKYTLLIKLQ